MRLKHFEAIMYYVSFFLILVGEVDVLYEIPESRGMTVINTQASISNYYMTDMLSIPVLDWTICVWVKFPLTARTTIISIATEGKDVWNLSNHAYFDPLCFPCSRKIQTPPNYKHIET